MKKLLTIALIVASTTAFAGFDNDHAKGGFNGGYVGTPTSVAQALKAKDDAQVILTGYITRQIDHDEFFFKDSTGEIKIEVDDHAWNGLNVSPNDKITIQGKVDQDALKAAEIEVYNIRKAD
ncbi:MULTISPECIES: YgiW/YdeI family stress tolerance OB fold protein [unclassified Lonepinella]|uniref:YgiW/YdeI family stress tolerance OB fold protein n=1 Tax=unclassified Lonepinella TaxID=2642006 RepID=UPI0036D9BC70